MSELEALRAVAVLAEQLCLALAATSCPGAVTPIVDKLNEALEHVQ